MTLDETYARIIRNIESSGHLQDAITALQWLCFSKRPLNLPEIVEVFAIKNGNGGGCFKEERLADPEDIMVVCSSLITCSSEELTQPIGNSTAESLSSFDSSDDEVEQDSSDDELEQEIKQPVRIAHLSVKEYLLSDRNSFESNFQDQICHAMMAESCLHYLLHISDTAPLTKELVDQYPLARYAAEYWWQHAQKLDCVLDSVLHLALKLLNDSTRLLSWAKLSHFQVPHLDLKRHLRQMHLI